ncbi:MAG: type II secretion system protein [Sedimentisphaerales bacterium]
MFTGIKRMRRAFTLVELLVVISIIALMLAILMPSLNKAREQAKKIVCLSNFKTLGLGLNMYASSNNGRWPSKFNVASSDPLSVMNGAPILYYSSHQLALGDKNDTTSTRVTSFQSRMRTAFLDLLTPYIRDYKVFFCPGSSKSKHFAPFADYWKYSPPSARGIIIGQWSYQSYWLERSTKGQSMTEDELKRYGFSAIWGGGPAGQKGLNPLFSDLYYRYTDDKKPVNLRTWHMDGESVIFTDGHVQFIKPKSEWFAPIEVSRAAAMLYQ